MHVDYRDMRIGSVRPTAVITISLAVLLASLILMSCSGGGFAGTWEGVDDASQGAGLKIVQVEDHWKASQLDQPVLPWDANLFVEKGGSLVSFGNSRPSFKATISLDGDLLTVAVPGRSYHYARD
jgi:hypothetical protein